jgi:hypothetical protein
MTVESALTTEDITALAARCYRSHPEFCRVFLADWFPSKMPWVHRGIIALIRRTTDFLLDFGFEEWQEETAEWTPKDLDKIITNFLDEETGKPIFELHVDPDGTVRITINACNSVVIVMPRGFAKTTLLNSITLSEICYHETDFFLYLSEAADHAERQLETVKGELESNEMLRLVFGDKQPPRQSSKKWASNYIETTDGTQMAAIGTGGKVRGFAKRGKRPKVLLFDDLQDQDSVESDSQRAKDNRWFWRAARPAKRKGGRDIILGTLLHKEAILNKAIANRQFTGVRFGAVDRQGDPLWAYMKDHAQLEDDKLAAAEAGELPGWYMEFMSEFKDDEAKMFPESKMVYIHKGLENFVAVGQALDPAISKSKKAAEAAMAVVGIDREGRKHVLDYHGQRGMDPYDMLEKFFDHHFKWIAHLPPETQKHGVEAVQFQAALLPILRTMMVEKSKTHGPKAYFEVLPIYHGQTQKEARIKGICKPLLWSGHLTFDQRWGKLHTQFVDFPGELVDGPDVVAMAIALLDPYVMLGLGENDNQVQAQLEADTAPPLHLVVGGNFRHAP